MEEREPRFDLYARRHLDGDWMVIIRNHKTGKCYAKGSEDYIYAVRERIYDEIWETGNSSVLLRYYRVAYQRNIYTLPAI